MSTTHTQGPWKVNRDQIRYSEEGMYLSGLVIENPSEDLAVASIVEWQSPLEAEANAALIAEAGTVAHETGKTPRQLAEENRELLKALKSVTDELEARLALVEGTQEEYSALTRAFHAIAKAEGKEPA